eukprot:9370261-Alexandrium_andersonii.AAC.1
MGARVLMCVARALACERQSSGAEHAHGCASVREPDTSAGMPLRPCPGVPCGDQTGQSVRRRHGVR